MKTTKIAKCPNCCPDGKAIFHADFNLWVCSNCGFKKRLRQNKRTSEKETESQSQKLLELIRDYARGQEVSIQNRQLIGRKLFIAFCWGEGILIEQIVGTIGVKGKVKAKHYYFGGKREIS